MTHGRPFKVQYLSFSLLPFLTFFLGYSKAPTSATEQRLNLCLPTILQKRGANTGTQCVRLVHADMLRIAPQRSILHIASVRTLQDGELTERVIS